MNLQTLCETEGASDKGHTLQDSTDTQRLREARPHREKVARGCMKFRGMGGEGTEGQRQRAVGCLLGVITCLNMDCGDVATAAKDLKATKLSVHFIFIFLRFFFF